MKRMKDMNDPGEEWIRPSPVLPFHLFDVLPELMSSSLKCLFAVLLIVGCNPVRAQEAASPGGNPAAESQPSAAPGQPVGRAITLSDFGAEDLGYLAIPNTPPMVGIVLVPDAYGLDDFTKHEAERLASEGYLAVAIDIYDGRRPNDPGQIANMVANLDGPTVMKTVNAGIRLFNESPKFRVDHVVVVGWGVGANYAWQAANEESGPDGAILFYGPVESGPVKRCPLPVCALYSDRDPSVTRGSVLDFQHALRDAGSDFTAWFIAAGPGWSNPQSRNYSPVEDREAWKVAEPFLIRIGAEPVRKKGPNAIDKVKDGVEDLLKKL
jgi:carboxymethylenebutenolidase